MTGIIAGCKADLDLVRKIVRDSGSPVKLYRGMQNDQAYRVSIEPDVSLGDVGARQ